MIVYNEKQILEINIYNEIFLYVFIRKQILVKREKRSEVILINSVIFMLFINSQQL